MTGFPTESTQFFNGITRQWTLTFVWEGPIITMNAAHSGRSNRFLLNDNIKEWRDAWRLMSKGCPRLESCTIDVWHLTATRRKTDAVACAPTYKAALDGLRDYKDENQVKQYRVLADDGPDYVTRVTFHAPTFAGRDALVVTLQGDAAAAGEVA